MQQNTQETLAEDSESGGYNGDWHRADVICGGFPCQDVSVAGRGAGITGSRSSLWKYLCGAIRMVRPKYAIVENVAALLGRGMGTVLGDLAEIGYDTEWHCIPAAYVGAAHIRDRTWILANASGDGLQGPILTPDSIEKSGSPFDWSAPARAFVPLNADYWKAESIFLGENDDDADWMDRIQSLGNAVVPQIPEIIGRIISED